MASIARDLNVDETTVLRLAHSSDQRNALVSADGRNIIASIERDTIQKKLSNTISKEVVSKSEFRAQNDIDVDSLSILLNELEGQLVTFEDNVCSQNYENSLSDAVSSLLKQSLEEVQLVYIIPSQLPGLPPFWFTFRTLKHVLTSQNLVEKFHIQEDAASIRCTPKQLTEDKRDTMGTDLQSGALAYINLQKFCEDFPELFANLEVAHRYFETLSNVQIMDSFALSALWLSNFEKECEQMLRQNRHVDLSVSQFTALHAFAADKSL